MSTLSLKEVSILITRPREEASILAAEIRQLGGDAVVFPTIDIVLKQDNAVIQAIEQLDQFDIAIFASLQAVKAVLPLIQRRWQFLPKITWGAIGAGTAHALTLQGFSEVFYPLAKPFESETLLEHPMLQRVFGKSIVVFQGQEGRQLLKDTLYDRGAKVTAIESYQRVLPDMEHRWPMWQKIDIIIMTSRMGLTNLSLMLGDHISSILTLPILVSNTRLLADANALGFKEVILAEGADNESILVALMKWAKG